MCSKVLRIPITHIKDTTSTNTNERRISCASTLEHNKVSESVILPDINEQREVMDIEKIYELLSKKCDKKISKRDHVEKFNEKIRKSLSSYIKHYDYVMKEGTGNFKQKPETDLEIARPLTATMHKMHRAGTDNYYHTERTPKGKTNLRKLTPRECARLQGLEDTYKIVVSDNYCIQSQGSIYFESKELAQKAINEVTEERLKKYIFNVKE